jgi:hypothetical protein
VITKWLIKNDRVKVSRKYEVTDYTELSSPDENIQDYLTKIVLTSKRNPELLQRAAKLLGADEWAKYAQLVLTNRIRLRHGNFGEIIGKEILREFEGFVSPVEKLRYGISKEASLAGTDLCVFRLNDSGAIVEVCFGETKVRIDRDNSKAVEAHEQLVADRELHFAEILDFIANCLAERQDPMYEQVQDILFSKLKVAENFKIVLVFEKSFWSEKCLENLDEEENILEPLTVKVVLIDGLRNLIAAVFEKAGYISSFDHD